MEGFSATAILVFLCFELGVFVFSGKFMEPFFLAGATARCRVFRDHVHLALTAIFTDLRMGGRSVRFFAPDSPAFAGRADLPQQNR